MLLLLLLLLLLRYEENHQNATSDWSVFASLISFGLQLPAACNRGTANDLVLPTHLSSFWLATYRVTHLT